MENIIQNLKIGIKLSDFLKVFLVGIIQFSLYGQEFSDSSRIINIHISVKKNNPFLNGKKKPLFKKDTSLECSTLFQISKMNKPKSVKLDSTGFISFHFRPNCYYFEKKSNDTIFLYVLRENVFYSGIYVVNRNLLFLIASPGWFLGGANPPPEYLGFIVSCGSLNKFWYINGKNVISRDYNNKKIYKKNFPINDDNLKYFTDDYFEKLSINNLLETTKNETNYKSTCRKKRHINLFNYYFTPHN